MVIGVLEAVNKVSRDDAPEGEDSFTPDDQRLLAAFAEFAGSVLHRLQLHDQMVRVLAPPLPARCVRGQRGA